MSEPHVQQAVSAYNLVVSVANSTTTVYNNCRAVGYNSVMSGLITVGTALADVTGVTNASYLVSICTSQNPQSWFASQHYKQDPVTGQEVPLWQRLFLGPLGAVQVSLTACGILGGVEAAAGSEWVIAALWADESGTIGLRAPGGMPPQLAAGQA